MALVSRRQMPNNRATSICPFVARGMNNARASKGRHRSQHGFGSQRREQRRRQITPVRQTAQRRAVDARVPLSSASPLWPPARRGSSPALFSAVCAGNYSPCQRAFLRQAASATDAPAALNRGSANDIPFAGISGYTPAFTRAMSAITLNRIGKPARQILIFNTMIQAHHRVIQWSPTPAA